MPVAATRWALALATAYTLALVALGAQGGTLDALAGRRGWGLHVAAYAALHALVWGLGQGRASRLVAGLRARPGALALAGVFALALGLRLAVVPYGLPSLRQADEDRYVREALRMIEDHTLDHRNLEHGAVAYEIQAAASSAYVIAAHLEGKHARIGNLPVAGHVRWGRTFMAGIGALTVLALAWLAAAPGPGVPPEASAGRGAVAPVAAALLAFDLVHLEHGGYVHDDAPALLLLVLAMGAIVRLAARPAPSPGASAVVGALAGVAIAGKYYNFPVLLPLALAHLGPAREGVPSPGAVGARRRALAASMAAVPAGFFLATPYTVLHFGDLLAQLSDMKVDTYAAAKGAALVRLLGPSVKGALGPVFVIALALGLIRRAAAPDRRDVLLLAFPLAFAALLGSFGKLYPRYLLPLHPFLALVAAEALVEARRAWEGRPGPGGARAARAGFVVLVGLGLAWNLGAATRFAQGRARPVHADLARLWIDSHLPRGSRILTEKRSTVELSTGHFDVDSVARIDGLDAEAIRARGVEYVVASSRSWDRGERREAYASLFDELHLVREFSTEARAPYGEPSDATGPAVRVFASGRFPLRLPASAIVAEAGLLDVPDAAGDRAIVLDGNRYEGGIVAQAGPVALPPGAYQVRVVFDSDVEAGRQVGRIQVRSALDSELLVDRPVPSPGPGTRRATRLADVTVETFVPVEVGFELKRPTGFRLHELRILALEPPAR